MLSIALAYTTEDQSAAQRIGGDLSAHVTFEHLNVGRSNDGPVLADLISTYEGRIIVLISDNFLTNPNCMLRGEVIFHHSREVLPVFIKSHGYDELEDEVTTHEASLNNQTEVMYYVNHWQDRYIELRRESEELTAAGGESFERYLRKIRDTSVQVEELLHTIKDYWSLTEAQFVANHYQQLFIFAERPKLWEEYKAFEESPSVDVSDIPGLEMLSAEEKAFLGAGAPVQEEVLEQEEMEEDLPEEQVIMPEAIEEVLAEEQGTVPMPEPAGIPETQEMSLEEQAEVWIERAWSMFDSGDVPAGLELLNTGREALPDHHDLHYHYALLLATATEDAAAARKEVEALLDKHPTHADALFLNGELNEAGGEFALAKENWEQLSDQLPFYPDLNFRLGVLLADHFPEEALDAAAYLRRASKDSPVNAEACYRYALLLIEPIGRTKKAIKLLRRAVQADPDHALAHYQLAVLLYEKGKFSAARNAFHMARTLEPAFDTPVNREAFADRPQRTLTPAVAATPAEEAALKALKQNIADLENMIEERDAAMQAALAPAPAPKIGDGKTVLISGTTSGIGRATARRLAQDGYRLILLGRREERLEALREELFTEYATDTHLLIVDIRERDRVVEAIASLPEGWQTIDILLNNAGKAKGFDPIQEGKYEHWEEMIDVNLKGLLSLTREISPLMVARGEGTIINVASTAGKEVYPNGNVYCATKHAVDALTYAMRLDLVKHGIRVGQIAPAHVEETEFAVVRFDGDTERAKIYEDFQPLRSRDVAEAIAFMVNQPRHVNIMDVVLQGTQQASSTVVDRSGREKFAPEEE